MNHILRSSILIFRLAFQLAYLFLEKWNGNEHT